MTRILVQRFSLGDIFAIERLISMHKMILPKRTSKFVTRMAGQPLSWRDPRPNTMRKANIKEFVAARDTVGF
jgi:hypothetical protein